MDVGRLLIVFGGLMLAVGLVLTFGPQIPWLGRLPGDIHVERPGFRFHFPIVTCLVLSIVVTLLLQLLNRLR